MTAVEHDWRRTHAVIVAVERYNGSDALNLDGPVHDAIGMRKWLTGRGVPPENIRLLASPMEHNRAALEAEHPGYRPAERADVRKVFRDGLREIDGEWLWIYWAGHGVQAPGGRWSLLYPETSDTDLQGLDADSLMDLVRTDHVHWDGADRVTVVIDACRRALPLDIHELADVPQPLTNVTQTRSERPVFWMRACQAGAVAMEQGGAGRFTSALLRQLETAGADGAGLDLDRVWKGVQDEFAQVRATGSSRQYPTMHVINWEQEERTVRLGPPAPPLDPEKRRFREMLVLEASGLLGADAAGSAGRVAARLCEQFTTAPPATTPPSAEELVDWALENPHGTITLLAELSAHAPVRTEIRKACHVLQDQWLTRAEYTELVALLGRLDERGRYDVAEEARALFGLVDLSCHDPAVLADALEELIPKPDQLPQLLRVVERFAAVDEGAVAADLRAWSLRCAERLGLKGQLMERRGEAEEYAEGVKAAGLAQDQRVQIRLHPSNGSGQRRAYEVWTRRGEDVTSLAKVDTPASLEEIQRGIDELLRTHARTRDTLVEFFVAPTDLELAVHRWQLDADGPLERSLGTDYPVVVRCTELRDNQRHVWKQRWERVDSAGTEDLEWLPAHLDTFKQVHGVLQGQEDAPGVVLTTPLRARSDVFNACLFDGVPVLIWHGEAEAAAARAELTALLGTERLRSLPQHLRKLRSASEADESHHGRHMALLWDDPHRPLPDQLDLSAP
ncbi:caspase family protein [Streptomyces sp. NEAU-YJ-81]|uniref:VMAP-C domain-containing protein n=1 Tax=Streptomyces sp. NEAU-YJ-81 TaxID=2820288 RepID=UPI001ABC36B6|nr:caspase family protein [Streptomyces sp. NEAU-YJ-81]MBO3675285.1 caspase family protein [Streptomyces sp. NEAU-YJ-81]